MFLLDDLIMAPGKAMYAVFEQLAKKAREEWLDDEGVKRDLQDLYAMLESGSISDREFESRECRLLERLQQIAAMKFQERWGSDASAPAPALEPGEIQEGEVVVVASDSSRTQTTPSTHTPTEGRRRSMPILDDVLASLMPSATPAKEPQPAAAPIADRQPPSPAMFERQPVPVVAQLSISQVIDSALRALSVLKMKMSSVTSVTRGEEGWRVTVELVERRSVPDTSDLLGVYELHLDESGNLLRYERTRMRRRCDLSW